MVYKKHQSSPAFTIVELLVVIVVIAILAAITIVSYAGISSRANISSLQSDLTNAVTQLKLDQVNSSSGAFPATLALANGGKGVSSSPGTTYTYAVSNTTNPQTFCITATKNNISYNITQDSNSQPGICPVLNLDAGNISSYPGTGTTWTDLSGNGNNGTLNGGVSYSAVNGGVLSFDGMDDYIALPTSLQIQAYSSMSVSAWIKIPNGVQQSADWGGYIIHNGPDYSVGSSIYALAINTSGTAVWSWAGNHLSMTSPSTYNNGNWHYLTGVWDGSNSILYVDGVLIISSAIVTNKTGTAGALDVGGASGLPTARSFNGLISAVTVSDKGLSASEIQQKFNFLRSRYGI